MKKRTRYIGWLSGCSVASLCAEGTLGRGGARERVLNVSLEGCRRHLRAAALHGQPRHPAAVMRNHGSYSETFSHGRLLAAFLKT